MSTGRRGIAGGRCPGVRATARENGPGFPAALTEATLNRYVCLLAFNVTLNWGAGV